MYATAQHNTPKDSNATPVALESPEVFLAFSWVGEASIKKYLLNMLKMANTQQVFFLSKTKARWSFFFFQF